MATPGETPTLTSIFTPPKGCFSTVHTSEFINFDITTPFYRLGPEPTSVKSCWPPNYEALPGFYFSPARDCPDGWTNARLETTITGQSTEILAHCCPTSSFILLDDGFNELTACTLTGLSTVTTVTLPDGQTRPLDRTGGVLAYSIQLRHKPEDFPSSPITQALPGSSTPSSAATSLAPTTPVDSPSSNLQPQSSGLSSGAKAGIGVGVTLSVLLLAGLFLVVYRFRKRHQVTPYGANSLPEYQGPGTVEKRAMITQLSDPPQLVLEATDSMPELASGRKKP